jgi:uncharacterized protein (TIGR01777 family)
MPKRILITGGNGFVGTAVQRLLKGRGDEVALLTRGRAGPGRIHWDYESNTLDANDLEGFDAVIHLAGEPIAGLWTRKKKRAIIESRRDGTTLLATTLSGLQNPPKTLVSASAIGIYGDRDDERLTEGSGTGEGFLADVVATWEHSTGPASAAGIRVVHLRLGLVVAPEGGMMGPVKPLFKAGLGGRIGDGEQWWSWVTLDDVARAFVHAVDDSALSGPYNVTAPNPVTNADFTHELASVLHRPSILPAPKFALKLAMRDMAEEMLLASQRVDSAHLRATGFEFKDVELRPALERLLG